MCIDVFKQEVYMKRLNMNISDEQMMILKMINACYGKSITKIVSEALDEWIGRNIVDNKYDVLLSLHRQYLRKAKEK